MKKILLAVFVPIALAAALFTLSGCTRAQRMSMHYKRVQVDQFYTTSYSGTLRWSYETMIQDPKLSKHGISASVYLYDAPPRVNRFRRGERICVAIHSFPGEEYYYRMGGGPPMFESIRGSGEPEVRGTPVSFESLWVGGAGGWEATCIRSAPPNDWRYSKSPSRWKWVDSLSPGSYTVRIKIKEYRTERTSTLDTSFTVE